MPIAAVISDLGNVLIDVDPDRFFAWLGSQTGLPPEEAERRFSASGIKERYERGVLDDGGFHRAVVDLFEWRRPVSRERFFEAWCDVFSPNREMIGWLTGLRPGIALVMLSNTSESHFGAIERRWPEAVRPFAGRLLLSCRFGRAKPAPEVFAAAVGLAGPGVRPGECLFIDDIALHIEAARAAGLQAVPYRGQADFLRCLRAGGVDTDLYGGEHERR